MHGMDALAEELCALGRRAYDRLLVDGTGGNFSVRTPDGNILCTPTLFSKGRLTPADLCLVDPDGRQVAGTRRPSTELQLHLAIYRAHAAIRAVVHTHPPYATTFAVRGESLPEGVLPEGDVFLGPVPLVPYATTGTAAMAEAIEPCVREHVAALLQNHGAVTWGPDLETAYVLTETLEAVARVVWQARLVGGERAIPVADRAPLAELRAKFRRQMGY